MAQARDVAGRRYALAIMAFVAEDQASEAAWSNVVDGLDALTSEGRYVAALQGDGMTDEQFQAVVRRVVPDAGPMQLNLLRLLRRKKRLALGPSIASYFRELLDDRRDVARATVRTAVPIDDERRQWFREQLAQLTGRSVELETEVDPDIIGGAVIRMGDRLIDGSTRTRLRGLRQRLEQGAL
ncbi:MAG: ATP synthase F1 subunit delta [Chloroflexi bacterium]|nr:ATP synthase F1 subunit delta [Chloroflexota bacterium]MQC27960.1 ATP synthase F1 subunit delta [Chloroflexota bacterium]